MAALRRWALFLDAFARIDDTIEAAFPGASREAFRRGRDRIVEALRVVAEVEDDGGAAEEEVGALLDAAMVESLVTLRDAVPASAAMGALASGEVVAALGGLMAATGRASARVRGLARDVVRGWRAGVEEEVGTATAALHVLDRAWPRPVPRPAGGEKPPAVFAGGYRDNDDDVVVKKHAEIVPEKLQAQPKKKPDIIDRCGEAKRQAEVVVSENKKPAFPKKREAGPIVSVRDAKTAKVSEPKIPPAYTEASAKMPPPPPPKKTFPTTIGGAGDKRTTTTVPPKPSIAEEKKMEATKRKLHERYQEAEDAKRRRTIQVIDPPPPPPPPPKTKSQMQGRTARGRASCYAGERRFSASSIPRRV